MPEKKRKKAVYYFNNYCLAALKTTLHKYRALMVSRSANFIQKVTYNFT